jgi:hypothetical protein
MKKIIIALAITCSSFAAGYAQSLLNKVPANASVVLKYSGENFTRNLPLKKIDSYNFVKQNLFKTLKIDTLTSLQNLGINFEKDTYQYIAMGDSTVNFVTLLNLQSVPQFLQLVQANYHAEMKPEKKNGYEFLSISADTYLGWNDKQAVLVVTSYQNKRNYYDYTTTTTDSTTAVAVADSAMAMVDTTITFTPPKIVDEEVPPAPAEKPLARKTTKGKTKTGGIAKKQHPGATKRLPGKKKPAAPAEESTEEMIVTDAPKAYYEDTVAQAKREAWYKEQEKITAARQKQVADSIINNSFNSSFASIENEVSYRKMIEPAAHVSVWLNYENLLKQYWSYFFKGFSPRRYYDYEPAYVDSATDKSFRSAMNVYFEKDKMRIEQKAWSPDAEMANLGKELYNSKQNPALANYVNPDNIGYMSASINTEAMANYYYKLIRQYMSSYPYVREYAEVVDVYMDLIEIIIDEKAIAELMPGNMLFVLHDMTTKQVTYTDYVYDEKDFKSKEVKKTKQELAPNFTFVMETKKESFMKKVANLPLKYAKKEKYDYQDKGGYYELAFDKEKYPISSLYFMVKGGKVIVTTNKASIDMTLNNTAGYPLDADTKNSILANNYSLKLNSKKLVRQIRGELSSSLNKKISQYMEDNLGDVKMESSLKDGMMQGTTTMAVTGNHANSLEFFFNMIDAINDIMEKDKLEREKKVD